MNNDKWEESFNKKIGMAIKFYRKTFRQENSTKIGISANELSERIKKLGISLPRTAISDIENGYKKSIKITEILIIAAALKIPPIFLLVPQPITDYISNETFLFEMFPDIKMDANTALSWLSGEESSIDYSENSAISADNKYRETMKESKIENKDNVEISKLLGYEKLIGELIRIGLESNKKVTSDLANKFFEQNPDKDPETYTPTVGELRNLSKQIRKQAEKNKNA